MAWVEFAIALLLFFLSHALPARPAIRAALTATLGERGFLIAYGLLSLIMLGWLIMAAGRAPYIIVWPLAPWQVWAPNIVMPACCAPLGFGVGAANPLSLGGARSELFDVERPGMAGVVRHPILWTLSHLIPNGELAHVILFGLFAAVSAFGMVMIDRRRRRHFGETERLRLTGRTSVRPLQAAIGGRWRGEGLEHQFWPRLLASILLHAAMLLLHPYLIGVGALPV